MTQKPTAVVIGAGIGGISTDARLAKKLDEKLYTCSAIMFYWGVDKQYPQIAHHNVFLGGDYKASFDQIFQNRDLPEEPSLYFAGASTHPGTGLPIELLSARITTQRILLEKGTISVQNMVNAVVVATD
jgi:phytoene dehydrogenase-like protein